MKISKCVLCIVLCLAAPFLLLSCGEKTSSGGENVPGSLENPNISFFLWSEPSAEAKASYEAFEKKYGGKVTYEVTTWDELEGKIVTANAAGKGPDIVYANEQSFIKYALNSIIKPIDGLIDLSNEKWDPISQQLVWKGKHYVPVPKGTANEKLVYFNQTMFEAAGVKTPLEYFEEGDWTFANFEKCAREMTADTNGDGKTDQWGWASWQMHVFMYANGGKSVTIGEDGSVSVTLEEKNTMDGLQFLKDGYSKYGYIKPDGNTTWQTAFPQGEVAMMTENVFPAWGYMGDMKDEWDIVPFPVGPGNTEKKNIVSAGGNCLSFTTKNEAGAIAYLELQNEHTISIEQNQIKKVFSEAQQKRIKEARENSLLVSFEQNFGFWERTQWQLLFEVTNPETAVSATVQKWKPVLQSNINTALGLE